MREKNNEIIIAGTLLLLLTMSCLRGTYYADTVKMAGETWSMYDPGKFSCAIDDTATVYDITLSVRTSTDYPYRNLYLFVVTVFPSGTSVTDTIQGMVTDEKGNWLGRGAGDLREVTIPYKSNIYFPENGEYHFKVIHGMRDTLLRGVYDIGMRISHN
ncbi:MAG: gliding motility lipoprotein GldH [Bacteroidales bacterium]|nr:gliding motility lipoprotein GldH [Bacteroidales bacterium]